MFKPRKQFAISTRKQRNRQRTARFPLRSPSALVSLLLPVALLSMPASSMAQTDADILIATTGAVGSLLAEQGVNLVPVRVYTGGGKNLVVETGMNGTTIYGDGNVGMVMGQVKPGKASGGALAGIRGTSTALTAVASGNPQTTGTTSTMGNASGSVSAHSRVSAYSISTGG